MRIHDHHSIFPLTILIIIITTTSSSADTQFITNTCKKAFPPNGKLCINLLQSDPRSETASTVADLTEISCDLTKGIIADLESQIATLLNRSEIRGSDQLALQNCAAEYGYARSVLDGSLSSLRQTEDYHFEELKPILRVPVVCEAGFNGKASPFTGVKDRIVEYLSIPVGLARLVPMPLPGKSWK